MKKMMAVMTCLVVLSGIAGFAATASAEDKKVSDMTIGELKSALGFSGYIQAGYTYNLENPASMTNELRAFDGTADSFSLDLVELIFAKDAGLGTAGYKVKLSAGETAKLIHSAGMGEAGLDAFDLSEAYISYIAPLGKGLRFDAGKFGTFIGAEVMEAKDNPNYSRSFLYTWAEPLTHTGVKVSYPISDMVGVSLFIVNGWDNSTDNNSAKSYGASISLAPAKDITTSFNVLTGPEQAANNQDSRVLYDWVATAKLMDKLTFILNADYGREQNALAPGSAIWGGASAIIKYELTDSVSTAVRGEYFSDPDGYRTGTAQRLNEVTVSADFAMGDGMIVRPEFRHDISDQAVFLGGTKKKQDTVALAVMYAW